MLQTGIIKENHSSIQKANIEHYCSGKTYSFGSSPIYTNSDEKLTFAEVEITRSSACGENCTSCGLCPGQTVRVFAVNSAGAKTGDTVIIDMADKKVLSAAFLVYIVPVIMLIAGYFISDALFHSEGLAILTGFIFLAVTFVILIYADKKLKRRYTPRIVNILQTEKQRENAL